MKQGCLSIKTHLEGNAYSKGGAYRKESLKSSHYDRLNLMHTPIG